MEACSANQCQPMSLATLKRLDDSTIVSFVQKGGYHWNVGYNMVHRSLCLEIALHFVYWIYL